LRSSELKWAVREWLQLERWDIAASFLLPKKLMVRLNNTCQRADEVSLSGELTHCFNRLDRRIFGSAHRNKGVRVPRYVGLEKADEVGWHAHVLFRTPERISPAEMISMLHRLWIGQMRGFGARFCKERLFWAEPITGHYDLYSTKQIGGIGAADWLNAVLPPSPRHRHGK
jgi:hypothetical protein